MSNLIQQSQPPQAAVDQVIDLYNQGQLEQTISLAESLAKQYPNALILYDILGATYLGLKNTDKTIESYQKALQLNPNHTDAHNNMGMALYDQGRFDEAVESYQKAVKHEPDFADAHYNLGNALKQTGDLKKAIESYRVSLTINSNDAEVLLNYGNALKSYGDFEQAIEIYVQALKIDPNSAAAQTNMDNADEEKAEIDKNVADYARIAKLEIGSAEIATFTGIMLQVRGYPDAAIDSYKQAIKIKPDCAEAYSYMGAALNDKGELDAAIDSHKQAIKIKPDFAEAYTNMGITLNEKGELDAEIDIYKQVLKIKPNHDAAYINMIFPLQATKLQNWHLDDRLVSLTEGWNSNYAQIAKAILKYKLDLGSVSATESLNKVISLLSTADIVYISNPNFKNNECFSKPPIIEKITALVHFGRSGTGLLHSLIDGHPEVSTLPSIYLSEFFDHSTWKKIIAGGWEEMAERFVSTYEVLFDASSATPIATLSGHSIKNLGRKEGMANVGEKRNEILSVDKEVFSGELTRLMDYHDRLDALTFFKLVHFSFDKALNDDNRKNLIFYHIHNPDTYAQLNFLKSAPDANWLMMVREPVQSCESWARTSFRENNYKAVVNKVFQMLFEIDNVIFQNGNAIGLRLEDLKEYPKKTIPALCAWLGIKEEKSLYEMTAQGKKYWGGPRADFTKDGINPFGKTSINRKLGSVFSENDQFVLRTLFYPFSVRFGYAKENTEQFKTDLKKIRPMLDQMFDFERKIVMETKADAEKFMKSGSYLYLRSGMIERWNTLNEFHTYPNMIRPLKIN